MGWTRLTQGRQEFLPVLPPVADAAGEELRPFLSLSCLPPLLLWMLLALLVTWPALARSPEASPETGPLEVATGPADFDTCVKLALRQSPALIKSALEIEVRRLDEADSKADFFPSFHLRTRYYVSQPRSNVDNPLDYSFAIQSENYNPLVAYFSLKVKKIITQVTTLGHLKVIAAGIHRLGQGFLELNALEQVARLQGELAQIARENLRYAQERQKLGEIAPLEVQIAAQEVEVVAAEQERLVASQEKIREALRAFLDLKPGQPVHLNLTQGRRQVLGDFDAAQASLEEAKNRSFDLRIQKLAKELQSWNITLAKMKFMPNFNIAVQSPDPMTLTYVRGTFFSLGLSMPLFEGFKRVRNITRQKTILKQYGAEVEVKESDLLQSWREAQEKVRSAAAARRLARAQEELARLRERQGETLYRSGGEPLSLSLAARQARVKTQMQEVQKALDYDLAVLGLRHLSGELVYHYVHEDQFQQEQ